MAKQWVVDEDVVWALVRRGGGRAGIVHHELSGGVSAAWAQVGLRTVVCYYRQDDGRFEALAMRVPPGTNPLAVIAG
jgi:hypothetical protein